MCDVGERVFIWGNVAAFVFPFRAYEPCFFNSLLCRSAEATLQTWFSTGSSTGEAEARQQEHSIGAPRSALFMSSAFPNVGALKR
ncbi:hypothetical protein POVWA1_005530 [Plasmodium ovale wallikeri]|uniref:Uncharacterized protein n=1 Tax=Plasmodium ovale wallikeri TaxID=864142 RepID=A0A1A8YHS8_PLAOA|nr:hypothetical protein POVWA1_005530 [Plasmodium ovale wallikeri]